MSNKNSDISNDLKDIAKRFMGTIDHTDKYKVDEIPESKTMLVLSYIFPIIPFIKENGNSYIKYHSNQGMNVWVWYIMISLFIWMVHTGFPKWKYITDFFMIIITIALITAVAFGIKNVLNDKAIDVPILSKLNLVSIVCDFLGI